MKVIPLLLITLLLSISLAQAEEKIMYVGTDATWPPIEYVDINKNIVGYDPDYLAALAKETGLNLVMKNTSWDGIFGLLKSGHLEMIMSSVTITEERKKHYDLSKPYLLIYQSVVVRKGDTITSLADLNGKRVGAQFSTTAIIRTLPKANVKAKISTYDDIGLAFESLARGDVFAVICDSPVASYYVSKNKGYLNRFSLVFTTEESEEYGIALKKGNDELLKKINAGIDAVQASGEAKKIAIKWFGE